MRRRAAAVALAAALTVSLSGCVSWFLPPTADRTSTPTGERVAGDLQPFYGQVLNWSPCESGMQCATAVAPLDWSDPGGDRIELALVRQPATSSNRLGSLLVNPGGPGGSGYDFVANSVDYATDERLQAAYDIVGFDPRGVGRSTPVRCYEDPAELDAYIYDIYPGDPGSDEWLAAAAATSTAFGERCLELTGPLLGSVDTLSSARDLDMLRAALGDETLNYLGYSYGTLMGALYAELFPGKTGRLVLDGAVDPDATDFEGTRTQAVGFEGALTAFLTDCASAEDCPFSGTVEESRATIRALLDSLDASPLAAADGRELGSGTMFTAIILPLYNPLTWTDLYELFTTVFQGDPTYAFELADRYNDRAVDGTYLANTTEAFIGIKCLDNRDDASVEQMRAEAEQLAAVAPVFGPQMSWGGTGCSNWPEPPTRERGPIVAAGSTDILVIGTTNDPATPYEWAVSLAGTLENGHLVTYDGEGHTAYNKSNACVNDAVDAFLVDGTVPASDPRC